MRHALVFTAAALFAVIMSTPKSVPHGTVQPPSFGVYDPEMHCSKEKELSYRHLFISWANYTPGDMLRQLRAIQPSGQKPLVTLEPWADPAISPNAAALLTDVIAGKYDQRIEAIASEIKDFGSLVLLNWGQEMENVNGRYPWANPNARLYADAYRHFVSKARANANNILFIWSPAGERGLERYWPGDKYVDYVGISVFEFPAFDQAYHHKATRSFYDILKDKYPRVARYNKPVLIVECGVMGTRDYQLNWLEQARKDLQSFPLVEALFYFNAKDTPGAWGKGFDTPDWRLNGCDLADLLGAGNA
jgi:beta-mannanase